MILFSWLLFGTKRSLWCVHSWADNTLSHLDLKITTPASPAQGCSGQISSLCAGRRMKYLWRPRQQWGWQHHLARASPSHWRMPDLVLSALPLNRVLPEKPFTAESVQPSKQKQKPCFLVTSREQLEHFLNHLCNCCNRLVALLWKSNHRFS